MQRIIVDYPLFIRFMECITGYIGNKAYILATPYNIDIIGAEVEKVKLDEMTLEEFFKNHDIKDGIEK